MHGDVASDRRFEKLARDVGEVLAQHAFPRPVGEHRDELECLLAEFIYGPRRAEEKAS